MSTTLTLYRGEKSNWWPAPEIRLMSGMTLYEPWFGSSVTDYWRNLQQEVSGKFGLTVEKKAAAYAQYLRASGHPFALATAWSEVGSFTSDYNYVIHIPDAFLFYWGGTKDAPDIGEPVPPHEEGNVAADFIVLNAPTVNGSTILGFGHKTATREITFFHDMPLEYVESCNGKSPASLNIKKRADLSFEEKVKYGKFLRG
jgi:hypothetical protein